MCIIDHNTALFKWILSPPKTIILTFSLWARMQKKNRDKSAGEAMRETDLRNEKTVRLVIMNLRESFRLYQYKEIAKCILI